LSPASKLNGKSLTSRYFFSIRKGWLVLSLAVTGVRVTYRIMRLIQRRFKLFQWYKYTYIAFLQIIQFTITFCWQKRTKAYSLKYICGQPNKWELTKTMYYKRSITSIHTRKTTKTANIINEEQPKWHTINLLTSWVFFCWQQKPLIL
jgi:hypothetical protein